MKRILCIGDSNTFGFDPRSYIGDRYPEEVRWTDRLPGFEVVNRGLNGAKIPLNYERQIEIIRAVEPDLIIVMLGTNDILSGISAEQTAKRMDNFISAMKEEGKAIILISPPPVEFGEWVQSEEYSDEACELAEMYRKVAEKNGCMFADAGKWGVELTYDGVHFSEEGHDTFARRLEELLQRQIEIEKCGGKVKATCSYDVK